MTVCPMTPAFVASVVRTVLAEHDLPDTVVRVAALPFSWEVTLRDSGGVEWCLMVPEGSSQQFADVVREAFPLRKGRESSKGSSPELPLSCE